MRDTHSNSPTPRVYIFVINLTYALPLTTRLNFSATCYHELYTTIRRTSWNPPDKLARIILLTRWKLCPPRPSLEKWMFKDARRELSSVSGADRSADNFIDYSWREGRWRKEIPGDRVRARGELWMEQRQPLWRQRIGELRGCRRRHHKLQTRHFRWVITRSTLPRFTLIHPRDRGLQFPLNYRRYCYSFGAALELI